MTITGWNSNFTPTVLKTPKRSIFSLRTRKARLISPPRRRRNETPLDRCRSSYRPAWIYPFSQLLSFPLFQWLSHDAYLHVLLRHSETDEIYIDFREVAEFIQCEEAGEYSAANARLIAQLELLSEAEQLTLKNIL